LLLGFEGRGGEEGGDVVGFESSCSILGFSCLLV
jgi:hypothetical protein